MVRRRIRFVLPATLLVVFAASAMLRAGDWQTGDVIGYPQEMWGANPTTGSPSLLLLDNYYAVYAVVEVGLPGASGFSMRFTNPIAILTYLPAFGAPTALDNDYLDPSATPSGFFGGSVLALRLNVDFSDAGLTRGESIPFGDVTLCDVAPGLHDITVRDFLVIANTALGGGSTPYSIEQVNDVADDLDNAFIDGAISQFARDHLVIGACPPLCPTLCVPDPIVGNFVGTGGSIPNGTGQSLSRTINIPETGTIIDVNLRVDMSHDTYGSLLIRLTHGTSLDLASASNPGDTSNLSGSYIFDDEAATTLDAAALAAGTSIPTGSYRGDVSLAALDGTDMQGNWTLRVQDFDNAGAAGSVQDWTLIITTEGSDNTVCTCSMYVECVCLQVPLAYGNVNCTGPVNQVNLDDILCCLAGFSNFVSCPNADIAPPCTGNDVISLDDILAVLAAFGGADPCACP